MKRMLRRAFSMKHRIIFSVNPKPDLFIEGLFMMEVFSLIKYIKQDANMLLVIFLTVIVFLISGGWLDRRYDLIAGNFLYIPIMLACIWFEKRGLIYSTVISLVYSYELFKLYTGNIGDELARLSVYLVFAWLVVWINTGMKSQNRILSNFKKRLDQEILRLNTAEKLARLGSWEIDLSTGKTTWSDGLFQLFWLVPGSFEPTREKRIELAHPDDQNLIRESIERVIHEKSQFEIESRIVRSDGSLRWVLSRGYVVTDEMNEAQRFVDSIQDITEEKLKQDKILYMSTHDSLTGLYNRRFFDEELKRLDIESNLPISIVIGDLNGLKLTNDAFGHHQGDILIQKATEAIQGACRNEDILARWGGDEFILLLPKTSKEKTEEIVGRIRNICSLMSMDFMKIAISFGWDTKETINEDMQKVLKNAEDDMYENTMIESEGLRGSTINMILNTLHEKNPREEKHSKRVSVLSQAIGIAVGLSETENNKLKVLGLLHDIGKIAIEENILNKPDKLTEQELDEIKRHPEIGYRILKSSQDMSELAEYTLAHHERFDGLGYPRGLKTKEIPLLSRIVAVADAYDAMTSDRAYREALAENIAIEELVKNKGKQFDPYIVDVFVAHWSEIKGYDRMNASH